MTAAVRNRNLLGGGGARGGDGSGRISSRSRRKASRGAASAFRAVRAKAWNAVRAVVARGPLILISAGVLFLLGMAAFIYAVPLPTPVIPVATRIFDRNGAQFGTLFSQNRIPVPLSDVPEVLRKGIVAVEDERFYEHHGIDPIGVARAIVRNIQARQVVEGGSTITAQVARTLYLTQEVTVSRKIVEALLSLKLERVYTKSEILEMYLNEIYLGHGSYGVEVASMTYFGKSVRELDLAESALMAGLPRNPEGYSPYNHPDRALARRNLVLDLWASKGIITPEEAALAKAEAITLGSTGPPTQVGQYYIDYVVTQIQEARAAGAPLPTMAELYSGGYRVYTSADAAMQAAADKAVADFMPAGTPDASGVLQPQVGLVAMDPTNGYILAMVGGRSFSETKLNRAVPPGLNTAGVRRQPGSSFKPYLYTAVLDSGFPLTSTQVCEPVSYPSGSGAPYQPKDYGAHPYHYAPLTIRESVRISDNVTAVKWAYQIGVDKERQFAQRMGIDAPLTGDLSLALGSSEVSVLEMARGYSTLANGGLRVDPIALLRVEDRYGKVLYDRTTGLRPQRAVDERVAFLMNDLLKEPFRPGGTATGLLRYFSRPACGKTGTTDAQYDAWFCGYTPQVVCAVWVGNDTPSTLAGYGGTLAGPVWANFMAAAHQGLPVVDFPEPAGIIHLSICSETGLLPNPTCPTVEEIFIEGTQPRRVDPTNHGFWWGTEGGLPGNQGPGGGNPAPLPDAGEDNAAAD